MSSVQVSWLEGFSPSVLLFNLEANFQAEDYIAAVKEAWALINERDEQIFYVAADVSRVRILPLSIISTVFKAYKITHPSYAGYTIFIGAPSAIRNAVARFQSIVRTTHFGFVDTFDDLEAAIQTYHNQHQTT